MYRQEKEKEKRKKGRGSYKVPSHVQYTQMCHGNALEGSLVFWHDVGARDRGEDGVAVVNHRGSC